MKILSVNCGSSSLKFSVYEMPEEKLLASGVFDRVTIGGGYYKININGEQIYKDIDLPDHNVAFEMLKNELLELNVIKSFDEIKGVGHRVVQGADHYDKSVIVTDEIVEDIRSLAPLAPLHNPAAILGITAARNVMPNALHVVIFDTAFHQTMEPRKYLYAVPYDWYKKYNVRKYGAHGTSHKYIANYMEGVLGSKESKLIICHIGNGASISAVKDGKVIDTSMGFTPNSGLIMGTRTGDMDASIIPYMMENAQLSARDIDTIINKSSGLLGISGKSDMRDVREGAESGDKECRLALDMYVDRIVSYIARYYFELEGCDAIVFTAGIGENNSKTRKEVLEKLKFIGVRIDEKQNEIIAGFKDIHEGKITLDTSSIPVYVIPTNEEIMMARDVMELQKKRV